jgi:hypothetical protein
VSGLWESLEVLLTGCTGQSDEEASRGFGRKGDKQFLCSKEFFQAQIAIPSIEDWVEALKGPRGYLADIQAIEWPCIIERSAGWSCMLDRLTIMATVIQIVSDLTNHDDLSWSVIMKLHPIVTTLLLPLVDVLIQVQVIYNF